MTKSMEKGEEETGGIDYSIPIPEGVNVTIDRRIVKVAGPKGELTRELWYPGLHIDVAETDNGPAVVIKSDSSRKNIKAMAGTYRSHINNMIIGTNEGFFYKLKVLHAHFPMQVALTKEGNALSISNFLGERKPRVARVMEGVNVEIKSKGAEIVITGIDKEAVGQTTANIEQTTKIKGYDPRVFQDGIYLVEKGVAGRVSS
ncbi:50S ribosomal protein L6 [ANME-1 cluster archaeon GoMg2]|nr:50S ribosomal protein L6 [ANME-1 cluster archaeon GoMg2]